MVGVDVGGTERGTQAGDVDWVMKRSRKGTIGIRGAGQRENDPPFLGFGLVPGVVPL